MRVTTHMVNATAQKTGIPVHQSTLLDYINGDEGKQDTLLDALGKKTSPVTAQNYKKLAKSADTLAQAAKQLTATGEQSLFGKLQAGEDRENVHAAVETLVDAYNSTCRQLGSTSGELNVFYKQMLLEAASEHKAALEEVGVTVSKDGTLSLDKEALVAADTEKLAQVLGASGSFAGKIEFIAGRVSDNAQTNVQSVSNQYTAGGSLYAQLASKYDFWG